MESKRSPKCQICLRMLAVMLLVIVLCFASACSTAGTAGTDGSTQEETDSGSDSAKPEEDLTAWDYTLDDMGNYLAQCGDFVNDDYVTLSGISSAARLYGHVELYWWDVDNLAYNSTAYKTWQEYVGNDYYYIEFASSIMVLTNNGPFGMSILDSFTGDAEQLTADFLAFPYGYSYSEVVTPATECYSRDKTAVYTDYTSLIESYPDESYSYETDPVELPDSYCLRDDYMIFTKQQLSGTCWDVTGCTALSTAIMMAKGEYLELSESWISLALSYNMEHGNLPNYYYNIGTSYTYGDGSGMLGFDMVANASGIVLDEDFSNDEGFYVSQENVDEYYGYYSQFANTQIMEEFSLVHFYNYAIRNRGETIKNSMKKQIMENGSIIAWTSTEDWETGTANGEEVTYKDPDSAGTADHIVSIVGWDDDFTLSDGTTKQTGAWIVLNSWGQSSDKDGGIMYIFYEDGCYRNGDTDFFGYTYVGGTQDEGDVLFLDSVKESNATYTTDLKGIYAGDFTAEENETKQKNVFYGQDDISVTYSYSVADDVSVSGIGVYCGGEEVTDLFDISLDTGQQAFTVSAEGLEHGAYKIAVRYTDGETEGTYGNCLYLCDGTEINYVYLRSESQEGVQNNESYPLFYSFGSADCTLTYYTSDETGTLSYYVALATYSDVSSWSAKSEGVTFSQDSEWVEYVTVEYDLSASSEYVFTLETADGIQKDMTVEIVQTDTEWLTRCTMTQDGNASRSLLLPVSEAVGGTVGMPSKEGRIFAWYYDSGKSDAVQTDGSGANACLSYEKVVAIESPTNTIAESFVAYSKIYYLFLYGEWTTE